MHTVLRAFIREVLLSEAAQSAESAGKTGTGLIQAILNGKKTLVLFDVRGAEEALRRFDMSERVDEDRIVDALEPTVVGFIQLKKPSAPTRGALYVSASAAKKGYGPLMYDLAMSIFGKITSDRGSVSPAAAKVWQYYFSNRDDVTKELLDDIDDPKTPPKQDDAHLHVHSDEDPADNPLNYAYSGASADARSLLMNGDKLRAVGAELELSPDTVARLMCYAGSGLFRSSFLNSD